MKKVTTITLFAFGIIFSACSHQLTADKVPAEVKSAFSEKFPGATANWGKENATEYEAEFDYNGKSASANFLKDGSWLETEMEIAMAEVPAAVTAAVQQKYPGATISKVYKIENAKGGQTYEAEIKDGNSKKEMVLKADGTMVK